VGSPDASDALSYVYNSLVGGAGLCTAGDSVCGTGVDAGATVPSFPAFTLDRGAIAAGEGGCREVRRIFAVGMSSDSSSSCAVSYSRTLMSLKNKAARIAPAIGPTQ
jgi:hypothetical protein